MVFGDVTISKEPRKIDELWTKSVEAWFPNGKDKPNLTLLCVRPTSAQSKDTENGKLIAFEKILTAAVTSKPNANGSVQGDIKV